MRLYLDTSVLGAMFDKEPPGRVETTKVFFRKAESHTDILYISDVVLDEIALAPIGIRPALETILKQIRPAVLPESSETLKLAEAYVIDRVVPARFRDDARHVAIASVAGVDALISWNFKHLVNLRRKRLIHSVNIRLGYPLIDLISPEEVVYE